MQVNALAASKSAQIWGMYSVKGLLYDMDVTVSVPLPLHHLRMHHVSDAPCQVLASPWQRSHQLLVKVA